MKDGRRNLGYELVGTSSDGLVRDLYTTLITLTTPRPLDPSTFSL